MVSQFIIKQVVTFVKTKTSMNFKIIFLTISLLFIFGKSAVFSQSQQNDNEKIVSIIKKKRNFNKSNKLGFRIQLYYGNETKAKSLKAGFRIKFPNVVTNYKYDPPYWKIQVGYYKTRLEADKDLLIFQKKYSGAIVVPL